MKKTPEQKSNEKKAKKLALIEKRKQKKAAAKAKREAKKAAKLEKKRAKMALKKQKREEKKQKKLLRLQKQKERKAALREKKRLAREKKHNAQKAMKLKTKAQKKKKIVENNTNDNVVDIRAVSKMMKRSLNDLAKKFASYDVPSFEKEANKIKSLGYEITVLDGNDVEVSFTYKSSKKLKNKIENIVDNDDNDDNDVHPIQPTENEPEVDEPISVETVPAGDLLATDGEIDETGAIDIDDNDDNGDEDDIIDDDNDDENDNMIDYRDEQDEDIVDNRRDFFNTFGDDGEVSDY